MKFYTIIALIALVFSGSAVYAQITISGKAVDRDSKEPLPFATVGILGKSASTITNLNGEFDFHIPEEYRNEILVIRMLGYKNYETPVWTILSQGLVTLELEKSTTVLDEVVIRDSLTGGDVLRIALSRITDNYPMKPFLMDGFYRDIKKVAGTNISLLEAAVKIYDENYKEPRNKFKLREHVRLIEVRRSLGYESKFTSYFDQDNLLEDLLLHNNIRYRQIESREEMYNSVSRAPDSYFNGNEVFVITHTKEYYLKMFINKKDYAIIRLEFETGSSNEVLEKRRDLISKFGGIKKVIEYRYFNNVAYLNYMTMTSHVNWYDIKTNELKFETELIQQLLINDIEPNTKNRIGSTEKMRNYGLQFQHLNYNKEFWDNYNVIKQTPLDKQIIADLEKVGPLQKQFEDN
jgi:hypothetical protein